MKITCVRHPDLELPPSGSCQKCVDEMYLAMQAKYPQGGITYSYSGPSDVLLDGKKTPRDHDTEYIEYSVPDEIAESIENEIERRVDEWEKTCMCLSCQLSRAAKKQNS